MKQLIAVGLLATVWAGSNASVSAADPVKNDWPRFRGPTGDGISPAKGIPTTWSPTQNVLWSADLPKAFKIVPRDITVEKPADLRESGSPSDMQSQSFNPYSSPIVSGGKVFVATSGIRTSEHSLLCYDLADGKLLWETNIPPGPSGEFRLTTIVANIGKETTTLPNGKEKITRPSFGHVAGYNTITPCTDGERVYVAFSSGVLAAVDFQGKLLWHKTYVDLRGREQRKQPIRSEEFGTLSTSPVLYKDMVIMACDPGHGAPDYPRKGTPEYDFIKTTPAFINAFDCKTGELRYWEDRPNDAGNCSTPILVTWKDKTVLMHKNSRGILGFDPANGKVVWTANIQSYPTTSLVYSDGLLFMNTATIGRAAENIAFSVDAESTGNISRNVAWRFPSGPGGGYSSPVIMDGVMYKYLAAGGGNVGKGSTETSPFIGKLYCLDMKTGKQLHVLDMPGFSSWSSPVGSADGYLYFASGTKSYVVKTGPKPEIVAINNLGDYNPAPSPALTDGKLIIRGSAKLWCIGKP